MRLRHLAKLNPSVTGLGPHDAGRQISFLPLARIWADERFDPSQVIEFTGDVQSYNSVAEGDLVVPKVAPTFSHGRVAIARGLAGGRALATSEVFVLRTQHSQGAHFLRYRLLASDFRTEGEASCTGVAGLKRVSADFVLNTQVDPGAWTRRHQVVDFLDGECARTRELGIAFERYAATLGSQWLQRFERATTDEPRERRLKHFGAELTLGPFGSLLSADEYVSGGIPLINPVHIHWRGLRPDDAVTVTPEAAESLRRYRLRAGDVVTARRGELGRSAVVGAGEEGYLCGTGSARIRLSDRLRPEFLVLMLMTNRAKAHVLLTAVGSTMPNLNSKAFLDLRLPAWDVSEQDAAVNEALEAYLVMDGLIAEVKAAKIAVDEYRDALITEAVTGRLDVTSLAESQLDESAHAAQEGEPPEVLSA